MAYGYGVKYIDESSILGTFQDKATTISWLDCEGLLNSIRATFRQVTKASQLPLVSLSLTFANSHVSTVGPRSFSQPTTPSKTEGRVTRTIPGICKDHGSRLCVCRQMSGRL